jgi:hypothetical protein
MSNNTVVFCIYKHAEQADSAVDALRESGFSSADISVLMSETPENAAAGASSGAPGGMLGGALAWLAEAGTLAVPGGPFVATGPLMVLLENVGIGGTVGGLAGALIGAGASEHHAKHYQGRIQSGHVLISVHCEDFQRRNAAREILERAGAEDISSTGDSVSDYEADFRRNYATNHTDFGVAYSDAAPLYEFGFRMARSERFAGKKFEDVEPEFKAEYLLEFPSGDWNQASDLVLYGWERAGGAIRQGFALI